MSKKNEILIKEIAQYYGFIPQSDMLIEECAELIQAVNKYKRCMGNEVTDTKKKYNLIEEIADVEIMLAQIKYLLKINEVDINYIKDHKIARTMQRIESERNETLLLLGGVNRWGD